MPLSKSQFTNALSDVTNTNRSLNCLNEQLANTEALDSYEQYRVYATSISQFKESYVSNKK